MCFDFAPVGPVADRPNLAGLDRFPNGRLGLSGSAELLTHPKSQCRPQFSPQQGTHQATPQGFDQQTKNTAPYGTHERTHQGTEERAGV